MKSPVNLSGPGVFYLRRFLIFSLNIGLFKLSISFCVNLTDCGVQGIGPFHLGYRIWGYNVVHSTPWLSFNVHGICSDVHPFISDIRSLFPLFFLSLDRGLSILLILKNQLWVLLTFWIDFLFLIPLLSVLFFLFLLFILELIYSFSSFLRCLNDWF